ncbi:tumor necrosis factor receptor superfamily member 11A [Hyperolius riggenbachi]|uniref:tumor necrosis factor receptor superfamily member 11A n=1 Tax=Hyperolius riggenbachi TaxID=752182 RepID=UPI0035A308BA
MKERQAAWIFCALLATMSRLDAQTNLNCSEKEYQHAGKCCHKCEPGTHMKLRCTPSSDTECKPCSPNEYTTDWNDDLSCSHHMECDKGKLLEKLYDGNSTYPRKCVCRDGYHFDTDIETCIKNSVCGLGYGVRSSAQQNKDTECAPCQKGYFSNTSSLTEQCHLWTNCSKLGLEEVSPGTDKSDTICEPQTICEPISANSPTAMIISITIPLIVLGIAAFFICLFCYKKKCSLSKENISKWLPERCNNLCKPEKKNTPGESENCKSEIVNILVSGHPDLHHAKDSDFMQGKKVPMEDEYTDQRRSMEATGMESASDRDNDSGCPTYSDTGSERLLTPPYQEHPCDQTAEPASRKCFGEKCTAETLDQSYGGYSPRHENLTFTQAANHSPHRDEDTCSCSTSHPYTRSSSRDSSDSAWTSETPLQPSGNVTGDFNTTVISSAPIYNIQTRYLVMPCKRCSHDMFDPPEKEETMKQPVQVEDTDHCDSFVANPSPHRPTDMPTCPAAHEDCSEPCSPGGVFNSPAMSTQHSSDCTYCPNRGFSPVQEEGKPEFYILQKV